MRKRLSLATYAFIAGDKCAYRWTDQKQGITRKRLSLATYAFIAGDKCAYRWRQKCIPYSLYKFVTLCAVNMSSFEEVELKWKRTLKATNI